MCPFNQVAKQLPWRGIWGLLGECAKKVTEVKIFVWAVLYPYFLSYSQECSADGHTLVVVAATVDPKTHKGNAKYYTHNEAGTIWYNFNVMCWYKKFRFFWSTILIVLKLGSLAPNNMSEERKNGGEKPWQKGAREWHDQESCWMLIQGHTTIYHRQFWYIHKIWLPRDIK